MSSLLILSSVVYPVILLGKRVSTASRRVMSLRVVTHVSLPYSSDGLATTLYNFIWVSVQKYFRSVMETQTIRWQAVSQIERCNFNWSW